MEAKDVALLDELAGRSKRATFLFGLRMLSSLFRARRAGWRCRLVAPDGSTTPLDDPFLDTVAPVRRPRVLQLSRVRTETLQALQSISSEWHDASLRDLVWAFVTATQRHEPPPSVDADTLTHLIVHALSSGSPRLLEITRDLATQVSTTFESFAELSASSPLPHFETHLIEQRFLADQCQATHTAT
jgi:hypothetical protein